MVEVARAETRSHNRAVGWHQHGVPGNCINLAQMPSVPNTLRQLLVAAATVTISAACASSSYDAPNSLGVMPLRPPTPIWLGAVRGSGTTTVNGAAAVTPSQVPGWDHVMLSLDNTTAGGIYTWSLRSGTCASQGSIVGPTDRYAQFAIHADGSGAAEAVIPTLLSPTDSYAVIATPLSPASASSACADLAHASM
jgi:hypothetical protein